MILGCIADDFTGASDLANMLTKNGMLAVQFVGVPKTLDIKCEAAIIALKSRSNAPEEAVKESLAALEWLLAKGATQILFKYCSTFDSTQQGNIGPVAAALMARLGVKKAIVCPVFPANGRTLFNGHLFVQEKLLNESGMEHHPVTPMKDANIVRHLQAQTALKVGLVPFSVVRQGTGAIAAAIDAHDANLLVVDAVSNEDLIEIGAAVRGHKLITGGSGIALGLPRLYGLSHAPSPFQPQQGFGVVLSGSCSVMSQKQVAAYAQHHPALNVGAQAVLTGAMTPQHALEFVLAKAKMSPMVYSTTSPQEIKANHAAFGAEKTALAIEDFFGTLAVLLVQKGIKRLVVGGGETSGAVVQALKISHFFVGAEIAEGVPALLAEGVPALLAEGVPALLAMGETTLALALKSGNFGQEDFYERALKALGEA